MRLLLLFLLFPCVTYSQDSISKIAFGSCSNQDKPIPIFPIITQHQPDLFIYLGDNIYADTDNMCKMRRKYKKLAKNKDFKEFRKTTPIIATWDDHDYGQDDIGRHYKKKVKSKEIFLKFFNEPEESERRKHEGIYTSYNYTINGKVLQILLLDLRTFRDDLLPYNGSFSTDTNYRYFMDYSQYATSDSTILGETQWKWLEEELRKPADIRIIGSSTQFGTQYNGYETWANFPHEQKRMLELIQKTSANGVFFISGDLHYSELSKLESDTTYPIYDLTSSGLTEKWAFATPNSNRIGGPVMTNNFGLITINWLLPEPQITLEIWDVNNELRIQQVVSSLELKRVINGPPTGLEEE